MNRNKNKTLYHKIWSGLVVYNRVPMWACSDQHLIVWQTLHEITWNVAFPHRRLCVPGRGNESQRTEETIQSWTVWCHAVLGGINMIGLPDSSVCTSHSFWLSIKFLMKLIITTVSGGSCVQRLWFALISLICSLSLGEGWESVWVVAVGMIGNKSSPDNKMPLIL